jgi:hypothetical protein
MNELRNRNVEDILPIVDWAKGFPDAIRAIIERCANMQRQVALLRTRLQAPVLRLPSSRGCPLDLNRTAQSKGPQGIRLSRQ